MANLTSYATSSKHTSLRNMAGLRLGVQESCVMSLMEDRTILLVVTLPENALNSHKRTSKWPLFTGDYCSAFFYFIIDTKYFMENANILRA